MLSAILDKKLKVIRMATLKNSTTQDALAFFEEDA